MPPKTYRLYDTAGVELCSMMADGPDDIAAAVADATKNPEAEFRLESGNVVRLVDTGKKKKSQVSSRKAVPETMLLKDVPPPPPPPPKPPEYYSQATLQVIPFIYEEICWNFESSSGWTSYGLVGFDNPFYIMTTHTLVSSSVSKNHPDRLHPEMMLPVEYSSYTDAYPNRFVLHPDKAAIYDKEKNHLYVKGHMRESLKKWAYECFLAIGTQTITTEAAQVLAKQLKDTELAAAKNTLQAQERDRDSVRASYLTQLRQCLATTKLIAGIEASPQIDIAGQLQRIKAMPLVKKVSIDSDYFRCLVGPITITTKEDTRLRISSQTYAVGMIEVTLNMRTQELTLQNFTRRHAGRPHPHCNSSGRPCWGEIAASVVELGSKWMLAELMVVVIRFLQSVDPSDSWGSMIREWPVIKAATPAPTAATPAAVPVAAQPVVDNYEPSEDEESDEDDDD